MQSCLSQNDRLIKISCYNSCMSRKLSEEEKHQNILNREDRQREKREEAEKELDERCYEILQILRDVKEDSQVKYNSKYFAKHFKLSEPTIFRLIEKMRKQHLLKEKQVNGNYAIDPDYEEYFYSETTKKNIALVASLRGLLQQYKGTPLFESVTKLIYFLQPEVAKNDAVLSSGRVIVSPQMEFDINIRNWDRVYTALNKNQKIRFRYTKSYTNKTPQRIIWPYQLILENGSVYVWAYSEYTDLILMYDFNFMTDIVILNESFKLPKDFDINNYSGGGRLGAFASNKIEKFKIRFTGYAKEWIKNHKWADDQTFTEDEESTTITFSSSQFEKVFETMLSWGRQAQPLAPARLVKRWKEEIKVMYEKIEEEK